VRGGGGSTPYSVGETGFLLGSVPGCDLRLPGAGQPPVLALVSRHPGGASVRKLAPIGVLLLNGQAITQSPLNDGDRLTVGAIDIIARVSLPVPVVRVRLYDDSADEKVNRKQQDLDSLRSEMEEIRTQLVARYRQKRDQLAAKQQAVRRAARKVQEQKRQLDEELARQNSASHADAERELKSLAARLASKGRELQESEQRLRQREQELENTRLRKEAELAGREGKLQEDRESFAISQAQHQSDLVRLDRLAATLEQRQKQLHSTALEVDHRYEALQRDTRELEEQASQIDQWNEKIREEKEAQERERSGLEALRAEMASRSATLEGQQAMLASLRSRMERLRDEHRRQEQALDEQRRRQEVAEGEIAQRLAEARRLSQELQAEKLLRAEQQRQFDERRATVESAVAQLRGAQEQLSREVAALEERKRESEAATVRHHEQSALLEARTRAAEEERRQLAADRDSLNEKQANFARAESVLTALQEQIRKRADELAVRQSALDAQAERDREAREAVEAVQAALEARHQHHEQSLAARTAELEVERGALAETRSALEAREQTLSNEVRELIEGRTKLDDDRRSLDESLARFAEEERRITEARAEALAIQEALPELERRAEEALRRLAIGREQLRGSLAEIHDYVREGRADLEGLRDGVIREQQRLREQEQELHRARDTHRLAVAAFRQQMADWQAQLAEMKLSMASGEDRLERQLAEVEERSRKVAVTSQQLAQQAEELQRQEQEVVERRLEVDRHLTDMREWYRKKIRELARVETDAELPEPPGEQTPLTATRPGMLTMTGDVEPGDRKLGELLRSLELIDADTLSALLGEARRQRRSLRQLLLQGGYLTVFQMALIEAGNLDGLVLGPARVIDRLPATPHEAVYHVFDPRSEREAILRLLAESEMDDAVRPDEFRQRFASVVALHHTNLAATYEVLDVAGRPAVLQEWLAGLPSNDWPALSAVPGVWFRLLTQATLGLQTIHHAGLTHGNLQPGQVMMTVDGVLKLRGLGEPGWLSREPAPTTEASVAEDLRALGRCAVAWSTPAGERGSARTKPLPEILQTVLQRLCGGDEPIDSTAELLEVLDAAGRVIPANAAAWERFVRHVREHSSPAPMRRPG
jgi:chromosome segregation ATPase